MWFSSSCLQESEELPDKPCDGGAGSDLGYGGAIREVILVNRLPGKNVLLTVIRSQLLDHMDDKPVEHLADRGNVALQEDCHRPVVVVGHLVQEPTTGLDGAVQLLGEDLHPLHNVQLLLGMYKCLQEEGSC